MVRNFKEGFKNKNVHKNCKYQSILKQMCFFPPWKHASIWQSTLSNPITSRFSTFQGAWSHHMLYTVLHPNLSSWNDYFLGIGTFIHFLKLLIPSYPHHHQLLPLTQVSWFSCLLLSQERCLDPITRQRKNKENKIDRQEGRNVNTAIFRYRQRCLIPDPWPCQGKSRSLTLGSSRWWCWLPGGLRAVSAGSSEWYLQQHMKKMFPAGSYPTDN